MPLDTRKIAHIKAKIAKINTGRTQPIVFTIRHSDNSTSTLTVNAVWKPAQDADPTLEPPSVSVPGSPKTGGVDDIVAIVLQSDITLAQLRATVYVVPQSPTQSEPANRYVLTSITPKGIMAGGDRYVVTFTRQR